MPRFYFDVSDGGLVKDEDGRELLDASQIPAEVRQAICEVILHGELPASVLVSVRDEDRRTVMTATVSVGIDQPDTQH